MSQPNRPKKGAEPPRQYGLPAILSAVIVVLVLAGLVLMLVSNRSGSASTDLASRAVKLHGPRRRPDRHRHRWPRL